MRRTPLRLLPSLLLAAACGTEKVEPPPSEVCLDAACGANAACGAGGSCECLDGYGMNAGACLDIDECLENPCGANEACTNTDGSYTCHCAAGFVGGLGSCVPEITCADDPCAPDATCVDAGDGYTCACNPGFEGNGETCQDVDECAAGTDDCASNAACTNTEGSFECACQAGYSGDGRTCTDIDECDLGTHDCASNAVCTNVEGGFECACHAGYSGDGRTCTDIDECSLDTHDCDAHATCTNTEGSFDCACGAGFEGDGRSCSDIDECAAQTDDCAPEATCTNSAGSFDCACGTGYSGDGRTCSDDDECSAGTHNCDTNATCDNAPGSFLCSCNPGYTGNGVQCLDEDECSAGTHDCDPNATCTNSTGSFSCACNAGYTGPGTSCDPIYDIVLVFSNLPSAAERAAFEAAEARWESLIVGDRPNVTLSPGVCDIPAGYEAIDDLVIEVRLQAIDGPGGVLGSAGPRCTTSGLPINGIMTFDTADNADMIAAGTFEAVVLHEMGHVLGIGSLWSNHLANRSCATGGTGNGSDTRFTSSEAVSAWQALGGTGSVPVENAMGQGSCDSHWRENSSLQQELMSPVLSTGNQLSTITLRSLADLGYVVAPDSSADPFTRGPGTPLVAPSGPTFRLHDDIRRGPVHEVLPDGTLIPLQ